MSIRLAIVGVVVGSTGWSSVARGDDLKSALASVPKTMTGAVDEDSDATLGLFAQVLETRRSDVDEELKAIAVRCSEIAQSQYEKGDAQGGSQDLCVQAMNCLWWSSWPLDYFKENLDLKLSRPVLVGASMLMLARSPDTDLIAQFEKIEVEVTAGFPAKETGDVAQLVREGRRQCGEALNMLGNVSGLSEAESVGKLIEFGTKTLDWVTKDVIETARQRGAEVDWHPCSIGAQVNIAAIYCARERLKSLCERDASMVANGLASYNFKLFAPGQPSGKGEVDVSDLFKANVVPILVRDALTDSGREIYASLTGSSGGK